jgi:hypothetical protein
MLVQTIVAGWCYIDIFAIDIYAALNSLGVGLVVCC